MIDIRPCVLPLSCDQETTEYELCERMSVPDATVRPVRRRPEVNCLPSEKVCVRRDDIDGSSHTKRHTILSRVELFLSEVWPIALLKIMSYKLRA